MPILLVLVLTPQPGRAIPAFARKYGVKCYTCHTIPPALNKTGYMFKRLGYRMPPDEMDGTKAAPKVATLGNDIKFSHHQFARGDRPGKLHRGQDEWATASAPTSNSSFNLDEAALFVAGAVPDTGFSYFTHFELYQGGNTNLEQACRCATPAAAPTAVISSKPAKCTCRREKERGQPCSTTSSRIPLSSSPIPTLLTSLWTSTRSG